MSEFDRLYREHILDHYKNPRGHGALEPPTRTPRVRTRSAATRSSISVAFADDGDTIEDVRFSGAAARSRRPRRRC